MQPAWAKGRPQRGNAAPVTSPSNTAAGAAGPVKPPNYGTPTLLTLAQVQGAHTVQFGLYRTAQNALYSKNVLTLAAQVQGLRHLLRARQLAAARVPAQR